jgi:hypothetical protein
MTPIDRIKSLLGNLTMPSSLSQSDKALLLAVLIHQAHGHPARERRLNELGYIGCREDGVLKTLTFELADERAVVASWEVRRDAGGIHLRSRDEYYVPRDMAVSVFTAREADSEGLVRAEQVNLSEKYAAWCKDMKANEPKRFNEMRTRHAH